MTSDVSEVDQIIEKHKDSTKYNYCAIGGDGTINSLIDCLLRKGLDRPIVGCLPSGSGSDFFLVDNLSKN